MKTKKGLALVIANADYLQQNKLPTCKKDGNDMQKVFLYQAAYKTTPSCETFL